MGNEESQISGQTSPNAAVRQIPRGPYPSQAVKKAVQAQHELLIIVRGQRSTGKTTLVRRMQGGDFEEEYNPTSYLDSSEIPIKSDVFDNETVNVKVWDVVEKALLPPETNRKIEYPDATTIDTYKRADGLVVVIDTRHDDTVELAEKIIDGAPLDLPVIVFSNFQDEESVNPLIPERLMSKIGRFTFLPGSLKTNQGLIELSNWLKIPFMYMKKKQYASLLKLATEDLDVALMESREKAINFLQMDTALKNMPKIPTRPVKPPPVPAPAPEPDPKDEAIEELTKEDKQAIKEEVKETKNEQPRRQKVKLHRSSLKAEEAKKQTQKPAAQPKPSVPANKEEDDFFADDDGNDDALKLPSDDSSDEDLAPNPLVQAVPQKKTSPRQSPKAEQKKQESPKQQKPAAKVETNDDFFGDDDDNDDALKLPSDDSSDEDLAPNPLVQAVPQKKASPKVSPKAEPKKQESPKQVPVPETEDNDDFFGDDDGDDDALKLPSDHEESEDEKPNALVQPPQKKLGAAKAAPTKPEKPKVIAQKPLPKVENEDNDDFFGDDDGNDDALKLPSDDDSEDAPPVKIKPLPPLESLKPIVPAKTEVKPEVVEKKEELPPAPKQEEKPDNLPKRHRAKLRRH